MIEFEKPNIECLEINEDSNYAKFVCEPLERGYGVTIGNSLRRILLSSLPGCALTSIKINGIPEVESAKVKGNGTYALAKGSNTINITVTSEDGNDKIYTLVVNREMNTDTSLLKIENNRGSEVSKSEDSNTYIINVQYEISSINIKGIPNSSKSTVISVMVSPFPNTISVCSTTSAKR